MDENPFAKLIRSKTQLDYDAQKKLADLLEPYVWIDPDSNLIVFKDEASSLTSIQHVLVFMLAQKIKNLVNPDLSPIVSPSEVEVGTGLPGGTVRPKLGELTKKKLLIRSPRGYEMAPTFLVSEIQELLPER